MSGSPDSDLLLSAATKVGKNAVSVPSLKHGSLHVLGICEQRHHVFYTCFGKPLRAVALVMLGTSLGRFIGGGSNELSKRRTVHEPKFVT